MTAAPSFVIDAVDEYLKPFPVSFYNEENPEEILNLPITVHEVMKGFLSTGISIDELNELATHPTEAITVLDKIINALVKFPKANTETGEPGPRFVIPPSLIIPLLDYSADKWNPLKNG